MSNIKFDFAIAGKPETCWRCTQIGLPPNLIQTGEKYVLVTSSCGLLQSSACMDCFDRLKESIEEENEGEEWKDSRA